MNRTTLVLLLNVFFFAFYSCDTGKKEVKSTTDFTSDWRFWLGDVKDAETVEFDDSSWRVLNLPHDWSIEGDFDVAHPSGAGGGALPGGIGWYRKSFLMSRDMKGKKVFIDFDGVYMNSEVYLNGVLLGKRPNGYISFRYDLTPYLKQNGTNILAVKVDNNKQPNSRWYSGSGIYRDVRLQVLNPVHVDLWGTYITTPEVSTSRALMDVQTTIKNDWEKNVEVEVTSIVHDRDGKEICKEVENIQVQLSDTAICTQRLTLDRPHIWSLDKPYLYQVKTELRVNGNLTDTYYTTTGIRTFRFDAHKGFFLNDQPIKINGVCMHHDLGCLGSVANTRAIERQLEILKEMGCNGIRCSHNPPAPELLDLCDRMGFIVMDETFDMWYKSKTKYDYSRYFNEWHERDLDDLILRDRNHPSIFMWSIGNEVLEQWTHADRDTLSVEQANFILNFGFGKEQLAKEGESMSVNSLLCKKLADRTRLLDATRPVIAACHEPSPNNHLFRSNSLDIIGYNYHHQNYADVPMNFPGKPFLATETVSGLMTRGYYRMPSDQKYIWPLKGGNVSKKEREAYENANYLCSSYDNCHVPWGTYHENSLRMMQMNDFISGQYIWTGFDYLGEPTPFGFPARSSYFGIIDLAGFPKDVYYMYQSEWTDKTVLHLFPHWNWVEGQEIDMWAYYNQADEVELFVNGKSQGVKRKADGEYHVAWRVKYEPGKVKIVSRKAGKTVMEKEVRTAGEPTRIRLIPDRTQLCADGKDLSFITVEVLDKEGNLCPNADNLVQFDVEGNCFIAGVDNGSPFSMERFKDNKRKAFYGKCLVVLQNDGKVGTCTLKATSEGLESATIIINFQ